MNCTKCGKHTEHTNFATYRSPSGEVRRRGICKPCRGKYAEENFIRLKNWRKSYNEKNRTDKAIKSLERRAFAKSITDKIKSETPCADCGGFFPPVAMDFDHTGKKNKSIAGMVSKSYKKELILEEIKLCEIVCACCHRVRTQKRKQNHGRKF